ncbi:unnamed protein product [Arctogadus glacialis]
MSVIAREEQAAKTKADNIRVALEKIKEAQVKKLVIRVHLSDESSKTMMVDERQTVRQVLDNLLDKSHCGFSPDWSLVETIHELQMADKIGLACHGPVAVGTPTFSLA